MTTRGLASKRLLLAALYLGIVLVFLEGSARVLVWNDAFVHRIVGNDDASWRLQWRLRHRDSLDSPIYYSFDRWHPTRGWVLAPDLRGVHAMPVRREKTLSSNKGGLRGTTDYIYERIPGHRRVVVLGDSFTFGEDVSDDETYCARLARAMPGVDVINMGVHGYGYDQMLVTLEEDGVRYQPEVVVIGFLYADRDRGMLSFRDFAKPRFVLRGDDLALTHSPVPSPEQVLAEWHSTFGDLIEILGARLGKEARERKSVALTRALLLRMTEVIRGIGAQPVLVYLPTGAELTDDGPVPNAQEAFLEEVGQRGMARVVQMRPQFIDARRRGEPISPEGHYGPLEHEVVARGLLPVLAAPR